MTRILSRSLCAAAVLVALSTAREGLAQPKQDAGAPHGAADPAVELFDKGNALYRQSRWAEAEVQFQKAWDLKRSFDLAANLGDCELQIGQNREAAEHLAYATREFPLSGKPALKERLWKRFQEARARVGALRVIVDVPGAAVSIDGRKVGVAPLGDEVFVDPGRHVIEVELDGYEVGRADADIEKGASKDTAITLVKKKVSSPTVEPPVVTGGPSKAVLIAGSVTAGVALGAGVVLAVLANGKAADADDKHDEVAATGGPAACAGGGGALAKECNALRGLRGDASTFTNAAGWLFIGAGAVGAGTLLYGLLAPREVQKKGMTVAPMVGRGGGGVVFGGRW